MADNNRDVMSERPGAGDDAMDELNREDIIAGDSETERERIRESNDRDQALEREGVDARHNRGYDEAVKGQGPSVDPDSALSEVDRDDTVDE